MTIAIRPSTAAPLQEAAAKLEQILPGDKVAFPQDVASYVVRRAHYMNQKAGRTVYRTQVVGDETYVWLNQEDVDAQDR